MELLLSALQYANEKKIKKYLSSALWQMFVLYSEHKEELSAAQQQQLQ